MIQTLRQARDRKAKQQMRTKALTQARKRKRK